MFIRKYTKFHKEVYNVLSDRGWLPTWEFLLKCTVLQQLTCSKKYYYYTYMHMRVIDGNGK